MTVITTTEPTGATKKSRLDALAHVYGVDPRPESDDAGKLLCVVAREVWHESIRKGGDRGHSSQYGDDIITAGEIVSMVYVRFAENESITVESLEAANSTEAMMRTYCRNAVLDVLQGNIEYRRIEGVSVSATSMQEPSDDGSEAAANFMNPGEGGGATDSLAWVGNAGQYASQSAEDDFFADRDEDSLSTLHLLWEHIASEIIESVTSETYRIALTAYVIEGMQQHEVAEKHGIPMVWRNLLYKGEEGTGRALPQQEVREPRAPPSDDPRRSSCV